MINVTKVTSRNNICQHVYISTRDLDVSRIVCINSFYYTDIAWKRTTLI